MFHIVNDDELNRRKSNGRGRRDHRGGGGGSPITRFKQAQADFERAKKELEDFENSQRKKINPTFWTMLAWSPVIGTIMGLIYLGIGYVAWNIIKHFTGIN